MRPIVQRPIFATGRNAPNIVIRLPKLARHSALYITVPVAQRLVYFLLIPVFTRYLTPAEYGAWGYVNTAATLLGTLAPLGLITAYGYALKRPEAFPAGGPEVRRAALRTSMAATIVACLLAFPFFRMVNLEVDRPDLLWAVVLAATAVGSLVQLAKRRFQMLETPGPYAAIELATGLTVAAGSYLAVVMLGWGVLGMGTGLLLSALVGLIWSLKPMAPELTQAGGLQARKEAFAFGLPLFVHTGAAVILQFGDRFLLERLSTLDELGLYSLAGQISTAMLIITTATNQAYLPFLYRRHDDDPAVVAKAQLYIGGFYALAGLIGILITPPVIRHFVDARYAASVSSAQVLLAAGVIHGWSFLALGSLLVRKETKRIALATLTAATLNILLNFYMIPHWNSLGAAWATLIAEVALCVLMWQFSRSVRPKPPTASGADVLAAEQ